MNTREQFGKYLLLKKLTEDPLGETFRAGLLGSMGMERVSLLKVFNGQGLDGLRLWEASKDRQAIQGVLRSPNIGEGIEIGEIQGIPYAAYEYVSGKNMATLLEQAAKKRNYVPTEHALLITERVALALAAASENRLGGQRILHGFLVPQLTMISNEGETRLLGFEMAPGLRGFAANPVIRQHFGRYLSPETLAGAVPDRSDDIYSIGVFLFELLTGRPLPPPGSDGYASVIDQGVLAAEQEPIPEELRQLLQKTLVAREQRMSDVVAWHKALNSWMFEGQYNPTTFNLAFYMHNLFRQEIERENQEIEVEKTLPVPIQKPAPAAATTVAVPAVAAAAISSSPVESEKTENFIPEYARDEPKSKTALYAALAMTLVGIFAIAAYYFTVGPGGSNQGVDNTQNLASQAAPTTPPPPTETVVQGLTQDEIEEQVRQIIAAQREKFEEEQREKYDKRLADLQKKLDETNERRRRQELEREKQEIERQRQEEQDREDKAAAERAAEFQRQAEVKQAEEEAAAAAAAAAEEEAAAAQLAEQEPPPPVESPPPTTPQVRRGDLVELLPGVNPPVRVRVNARFPEMARRLRKSGAEVTVKALIDENGRVLETKLVGKKVGFGFDTEAEQAVKKGTFKPATVDGVAVKVWHNVNVKFQQQ